MEKQVYTGGKILTMEENVFAESVLVENGKIKAVGSNQDVLSLAKGAQLINLHGAVMIPAFIDAHSHISGYAFSLMQPSIEHAKDFSNIQKCIRDFIRKNGIQKGKWIQAKGLDPTQLREKRSPDKRILDEAAPDNPVLLQHQSGHNGVFNSMALRLLGVTPSTPSPEGGRIAVANGELTGYMEENAYLAYLQKLPTPSMEELSRNFQRAQEAYAGYGITTAQDGMLTGMLADIYACLCAEKKLWLDVVGYTGMAEKKLVLKKLEKYTEGYRDHFRLGGYKIFLDGSPQARTAWMRQPYEGAEDGYRGYGVMDDQAVRQSIEEALSEGKQILAHCNGDAAAEQYLKAFGAVLGADTAPKDIRPVMIHAQLLGRDQMESMKQLSMIPSFFIGHVYYWGDAHIANFGMERASHISPARSALRAGLPFTFHQDSPVTEPNMLESIWCAVNRVTRNGILLGEDETISPLEALKAVTKNAAYQYFEEKEKGSILPGKNADLAILDADPTACRPEDIRHIRVLETIKDGVTIYGGIG